MGDLCHQEWLISFGYIFFLFLRFVITLYFLFVMDILGFAKIRRGKMLFKKLKNMHKKKLMDWGGYSKPVYFTYFLKSLTFFFCKILLSVKKSYIVNEMFIIPHFLQKVFVQSVSCKFDNNGLNLSSVWNLNVWMILKYLYC